MNSNSGVIAENNQPALSPTRVQSQDSVTASAAATDSCEVVVMKSGEEISADVLEIGLSEIKYRKCHDENGPIFTVVKSDVFMIKHVDGTKTVINEQQRTQSISNKGGKSQLIAFILCFFFGLIGVHRFYLGYTAIGIIQLLTLGGLGIWTLIDLIMIATGDLKPRNGEYSDTFDD